MLQTINLIWNTASINYSLNIVGVVEAAGACRGAELPGDARGLPAGDSKIPLEGTV